MFLRSKRHPSPTPAWDLRLVGAAVGGGATAEPDTVGMLKQGHQSHRDLNLSKLALRVRGSAPREEISH